MITKLISLYQLMKVIERLINKWPINAVVCFTIIVMFFVLFFC